MKKNPTPYAQLRQEAQKLGMILGQAYTERLLTGTELSKYLGVSMFFIWTHPEIPRVRLGKKLVRFDLAAVKKWLRKQK